jgi:sensor histidine kinase regulating citrate/malate metabolism
MENIKSEATIVKEYYSAIDSKIDDINKLRHEMHNYLSVITSTDKVSNEMIELTAKLDNESEKLLDKKFCDNRLLNILINKEYREAKRFDIDLKCTLNFSNNIGVDDYDFCSCILNLLENAIQANKSQSADGAKWIVIKSKIIGNYLIVKQINTMYTELRRNENGEFLTSKEDKDNHGLGLVILSDICKKYGGYCEFEKKEGLFYSTLTFNLHIN